MKKEYFCLVDALQSMEHLLHSLLVVRFVITLKLSFLVMKGHEEEFRLTRRISEEGLLYYQNSTNYRTSLLVMGVL